MKFLSYEVAAFVRFGQGFQVPLENQGLVLVEGENHDAPGAVASNGASKSLAVVEAPLWGLFEKFARYGKAAVADAACDPTRGADVTIRTDRFTLHRVRTPKGRTTIELFSPDGRPIALSKDPSHRAEEVNAWIGMDYATFRAAVVLTGEQVLARAGYAAQMGVLETLLWLGELGQASVLAHESARQWEQQTGHHRTELARDRRVCEEAATALSVAHAALQAGVGADDEALLKEQIIQAEFASSHVAGVRTVVADLRRTLYGATKGVAEARAELATTLRTLEKKRGEVTATVCPTCQRPFKSEAETAKTRKRITEEIAELEKAAGALQKKARKAEEGVQTLQHKVSAHEAEAASLTSQAGGLVGLRGQLDEMARRHEVLQRHVQEATTRWEEADRALTRRTEELAQTERAATRAGFWASGYGRDGLQADLVKSAIPVAQQAADRFAQVLTGGQLRVVFESIRDSRRDDLLRIEGASAPTYDGLSAGEKQRVDLIVALALREVSRLRMPAPLGWAVYDEVFDHLDDAGLGAVAQLLQDEVRAGGTIFVVTHRPGMKALFPSAKVMRVIRSGGSSWVES